MTLNRTLILAVSLISIAASSTFAQETSTTPAPHAKHEKLTADQKAAKKAEWEKMTPEQRKEAKAKHKAKWKERYDNATPEQQAKMRERMKEHRANKHEKKSDTTAETPAQ